MIQDVLEDMKSLLLLHLEDELKRQDGHAGDGLKSRKVSDVLIGNESVNAKALPIIALDPESFEPDEIIIGKKDAIYTIQIKCVAKHTSSEKAQRLLWRLMRAVENVFEIYTDTEAEAFFDYTTIGMDFKATVLDFNEDRKTESGGILIAQVKERLKAYVNDQI